MIRHTDIQNSLLHLVGWEQNYNTAEYRITESLTKSESGFYFQQVHPLLTLDNLRSIAPDFDNITFATYDAAKPYLTADIVKFNGTLYKAKRATSGNEPGPDSEYWLETDPFSEWLESRTKAGIQKAILRFCTEKTINGSYTSLCEHKVLFQNTGRIVDTIENRNRLVGFEITPVRSRGVTLKLNKIGLQFTQPGVYTIYIMQSGLSEPYKVLELTKTKANTMEWFELTDLYLPYSADNLDAGGSWYICYNQQAIPVNSKAIRKDKDWAKSPCSGCSRLEYDSWKIWSRYLEVHPFRVCNTDVHYTTGDELITPGLPELWDIERNEYTYDTNYGLNLDVSVECDITEFIISQRNLFQDIIAKQVAVDLLREFAYNPNVRTNRNSINASRTDILSLLDGDAAAFHESGLSKELDRAYKAIDISVKGIDRVCLPCGNHGIKYRTV